MDLQELCSMSDKALSHFNLGLYKDNALSFKMRFGDQEAFMYLIRRGLSLQQTDKEGLSVVHLAVKMEKIEFLAYMMEGEFSSPTLDRLAETASPSKEDCMFDIYAH